MLFLFATSNKVTLLGALHSLLKLNNPNIPIQSKQKLSHFYLGGQSRYSINEPITEAMISSTQSIINSTDLQQCWGNEMYSVLEHNRRFENFKTFYYHYKEFINKYKYAPGSSHYYEAK